MHDCRSHGGRSARITVQRPAQATPLHRRSASSHAPTKKHKRLRAVILNLERLDKFSWRASSSSLPDAGRSATCSRGEAAFVRRARATAHMMVQIWILCMYRHRRPLLSMSSTTTHAIFASCSDSVLLDRPTCDNSGPRAQDLHPCLAVGWTSPPMELNEHVRITEVVLRSPSSHDTRMHHGKALVRKASSEVKERERERAREGERERDKESTCCTPLSARCQCGRSSVDFVRGSSARANCARAARSLAALSMLNGAV